MKRALKLLCSLIGGGILILAAIAVTLIDFSNDDNLDRFIEDKMAAIEAKGLAVAFIRDGKISWSKNYGYADVEAGKPVTDETIFQIASVSKLVTGVAIMQLYEKGLIDLDASINDYLPFAIVNPNFADQKITTRMLLQHRSSLVDNEDAYRSTFTFFSGSPDPELTLEELVRGYFLAGGELYDVEANFSTSPPGTEQDYSNVAFGLLGFIAEQVTKQPFNTYCNQNIFLPLGMQSTGWFSTEIELERMAVQYDGETRLKPYGVASYPDGGLKTTVADFSKFLIAMMNGGQYQGQRVLQPSTLQEMMPENPSDNLAISPDVFSDLMVDTEGHPVPGHLGGDPGISSFAGFSKSNGRGLIIFANGSQSLISPSPFMLLKLLNIRSPWRRLADEAGLFQ